MDQVQSIEHLCLAIAQIKALKEGFVTNFYFDSHKHNIWIMKGDCLFERMGNTLFIIKQSSTFWNVFYCSTKNEQLSVDLGNFISKYHTKTMIFDIVGREEQCKPIVQLFKSTGCIESTTLVRMIRMDEPYEYKPNFTIRKANIYDLQHISLLLNKYFDAQTEQIPYDEELLDFINNGNIIICEEHGIIAGFLIYEFKTTTTFLRYWFTIPEFRDQKVGSRLLRRFLEEGKNTKRQIFWVINSNVNAIKRYKHYGFKEENMFDFVLKYKK